VKTTREIRATFSDEHVVVYQAYGHEIAKAALAGKRFAGPFSRSRMTWIKPSLLWACYRSGWATKPAQEHLLEVTLSREGFDRLLGDACLASYEEEVHGSVESFREQLAAAPNRVQWDPERDIHLQPIAGIRSLQLGIGGACVPDFVDTYCLEIRDVTDLVRRIQALVATGQIDEAAAQLPAVEIYALSPRVARQLGASA
jgi:hypothetical protein